MDEAWIEQAIERYQRMERLVAEFLAFARGDAMESPEPVDPVALVGRSVENARRAGQEVRLAPEARSEPAPGGTAMLRPDAVTRAVDNLIANATRYGSQ